ncbi:PaaI family thioesterase [Pontibacter sp. 13R65]|uniref:PaaI family thioesterase n=1 Tax=Pontibacter sp. 13R65 TaxID=3127458 RepID=UPI00301D807C
MEIESHYRQLEGLYHTANIQDFYSGSTILVSRDQAEITLPADSKFFHGAAAVHGSVYFKLLDDAAWFAAASIVQDYFIVTSSFQINLLRPIKEGILKSKGKIRSASRQLIIADSVLYNQKGKEVAFGTGQFMRTSQPISALDGYKQL